ncbi:MAG: bifunctional phosphopantothenoylcysteine decarboxylase/phosphopantothenate--cysteine ligase CoaBC [Flavobacteriaceae bacterium]|nr:bifunctional phosphopantothenoylcysteine decarboxylase/phosphopantothenate--cysteine ligase CoaBC [Flavobacteriaceae bacterium]
MSVLKNKKILLAVTAGIAAYKTPLLVRELVKKNADVRVIITPEALEFVTPLTLSTLSGKPVEWEFTKEKGQWNNHVEMGLWADLMIIAPLTARTLSAMADGYCDNLVMATYLSAKCPVFVAPAMDLDMYQHPSTQNNLQKLIENGNHVIPAASGELASGLIGQGRMEEPENIAQFIEEFFQKNQPLQGKKILVSAGPTYEPIDPVRFIGNHSSGKMGFEIAKKAEEMGAEVTLVAGPTSLSIDNQKITRIDVVSALEMKDAIDEKFDQQDVIIMAAAVADYRPKEVFDKKIKKKTDEMSIELVKNPDILKYLGTKKSDKFLVGFALETNNALEHAKGKLLSKNADMIVLNSLEDEGAGFGKETNKVTFVTRDQPAQSFPLKSKAEVAEDILNFIAQNLKKNA